MQAIITMVKSDLIFTIQPLNNSLPWIFKTPLRDQDRD